MPHVPNHSPIRAYSPILAPTNDDNEEAAASIQAPPPHSQVSADGGDAQTAVSDEPHAVEAPVVAKPIATKESPKKSSKKQNVKQAANKEAKSPSKTENARELESLAGLT